VAAFIWQSLKGVAISVLSRSAVVAAGDGVVSCALTGGAALLDVRSNVYFTLNEVGARIWAAIQEPKAVSEVVDMVTAQYNVDRLRCHDDLVALLQQLDDAGLIKILDTSDPQVRDLERSG
jgi:hypothetical protein